MGEDLKNAEDQNARSEYLKRFRKEVDFHHKVCYKFEKAYRMAKEVIV